MQILMNMSIASVLFLEHTFILQKYFYYWLSEYMLSKTEKTWSGGFCVSDFCLKFISYKGVDASCLSVRFALAKAHV